MRKNRGKSRLEIGSSNRGSPNQFVTDFKKPKRNTQYEAFKYPVTSTVSSNNFESIPINNLQTDRIGESGDSIRFSDYGINPETVIGSALSSESIVVPDNSVGVPAVKSRFNTAHSVGGETVKSKKISRKQIYDKAHFEFKQSETNNGGAINSTPSLTACNPESKLSFAKDEKHTTSFKKKTSKKYKHTKNRLNFKQSEVGNNGGVKESTSIRDSDKQNTKTTSNGKATDFINEKSGGQLERNSDKNVDSPASSSIPVLTTNKPESRLNFTREEKNIFSLEEKAEKLDKKLNKARNNLPAKSVNKKQMVYDEKKNKAKSKLTHEKETIPINDAKWNNPKPKTFIAKTTGLVLSTAVTKIHSKIHSVEDENVGVKTAHKAELLGESAYRGAKHLGKSAYRFHKNRPYRQFARLEKAKIKNKMKLDYQKALRENPRLKSNPISRLMQKRAIKRNYAKDLRNAQKTAQTAKKSAEIVSKARKAATAIIRKNPIFLIKLGILGFMFIMIMSLITMCVSVFQSGSAFIGAASYTAEFEDIDAASIAYTEWETDLRVEISEIETAQPDFDEYRYNIGNIGHNPFEIIAFLTAVYEDFVFADIVEILREIFDTQYVLVYEPEVEIRYRQELRTGTGVDSEGNTYEYTYYETVQYEWNILNVTLTVTPFATIIADLMDDEQTQHFHVLIYTHGARQFVGNPFDFNWLPFLSSIYGYRIHPINNVKQFHWGIDIGQPTGIPLHSGFDGVVAAVGFDANGYGNYVVIEDENGNQARYAHCHTVLVTTGQSVELGQVIATVGNTGASTGPHLHMEVSINGQRINPLFAVEFWNDGEEIDFDIDFED